MKYGQLPFNVDASGRAVAQGLGQLPKTKSKLPVLTLRPMLLGNCPVPFSGMVWHVAEFEKKSKRVAWPA